MSKRKYISTGAEWEDVVGYSRAVRIGKQIEISGTTAMKNRQVIAPDDPYEQARYIFKVIQSTLEQLGAKMEDVVRTRMYVTDIAHWEAVGKAHGEFFSGIKPASTLVEVSALISPDLLVEIEATAILD